MVPANLVKMDLGTGPMSVYNYLTLQLLLPSNCKFNNAKFCSNFIRAMSFSVGACLTYARIHVIRTLKRKGLPILPLNTL